MDVLKGSKNLEDEDRYFFNRLFLFNLNKLK